MKKLKTYTIALKNNTGYLLNIAFNSDSSKPVFIRLNGMDTGARYTRIGDAARYIEQMAKALGDKFYTVTGTAKDIPISGCSAWNNALIRHWYCGETFPKLEA